MIVSTKGRYALRVMIDLAEHQSDKYVPLKEVAARQEISEKYLENILKVLVQNGFLEGLRGKGGGYRLTRSPEQYTVEEILNLTEGNLATVSCLTPGAPTCHRMAECRTYNMWKGLDEMISDYFSAFVTSTQEYVTGEVKFKLYKGNIIKAGTTSPYSLYSESLASFTTGDLYDHHDADGFITLFGLPLKVRAMKMAELKKNETK